MKRHYILTSVFTALALISSCTKENPLESHTQDHHQDESTLIFARETPWSPPERLDIDRIMDAPVSDNSNEGYIGNGMNIETTPITRGKNIRQDIIDIERFQHHPHYNIMSNNIRTTTIDQFTYANESDYTKYTSFAGLVNIDASADILGIVNITNKTTIKNLFHRFYNETKSYVFGEYNYKYINKSYELLIDRNIIDTIKKDYLTPALSVALYSRHPSEVIDTYGSYVITGYDLGATLTAIYLADCKSSSEGESNANSLDQILDITIFGDSDSSDEESSSDSNSLFKAGFSGKWDTRDSLLYHNIFNNIYMTTLAEGGDALYPGEFSPAASIEDYHADYSGWVSSLTDEKTHIITSYKDKSLIPISSFILEKNLKDRYDYYTTNRGSETLLPMEPSTHVVHFRSNITGKIISSSTYIKTRFGDNILVKVRNHIDQEIDTYKRTTMLEDAHQAYNFAKIDIFSSEGNLQEILPFGTYEAYNILDEDYLHKAVINGTTYIVSSWEDEDSPYFKGKKIAFTVGNQLVVDDYQLQGLLDRLDSKVINLTYDDLLHNYTVYAL